MSANQQIFPLHETTNDHSRGRTTPQLETRTLIAITHTDCRTVLFPRQNLLTSHFFCAEFLGFTSVLAIFTTQQIQTAFSFLCSESRKQTEHFDDVVFFVGDGHQFTSCFSEMNPTPPVPHPCTHQNAEKSSECKNLQGYSTSMLTHRKTKGITWPQPQTKPAILNFG